MSGEDGATFPQKLWWAIDEAKHRLSTEDIGEFYDSEILDIDEKNALQLLLFGCLAKVRPRESSVNTPTLTKTNASHEDGTQQCSICVAFYDPSLLTPSPRPHSSMPGRSALSMT